MKKFFALLPGAITLAVVASCAWADVVINETNFPDANFRAYVSRSFDSNSDGTLSDEEIIDIGDVNVANSDISSLKGIEYFTELISLECSYNSIRELDLRSNILLQSLQCRNNLLTSLDVTNNHELRDIFADNMARWGEEPSIRFSTGYNNNQISALDVSFNFDLEHLALDGNALVYLDVSENEKLADLSVSGNSLAELDMGNKPELRKFHCIGNNLTAIDLTQCPALEDLKFSETYITDLDLSRNTALIEFECQDNQLKALDVSRNTALTKLWCWNNQLTKLNVSNNTALTDLRCDQNQLAVLDISKNTALTLLNCWNNQLTELDLSKNTALTSLGCEDNNLTALDVSKNTALTYLNCLRNQITALDVHNNILLTGIWCNGNQLTELDVSRNTALTHLHCDGNKLTELDLSNNTNLTSLQCHWNNLTSLDISKNIALTEMSCDNNQLTTLDVSSNTALTWLRCNNNHITALDLSKNTALTGLECSNNELTTLDLSANPNIYVMHCDQNAMQILKVKESDNAQYPYQADMRDYAGDNFTRIESITAITSRDTEINVMFSPQSSSITYFADKPERVIYRYNLGYTGSADIARSMNVTLLVTGSVTPQPVEDDSALPIGTIQPVELSQDVLEKAASAVNVDVSQLRTLSIDSITAPKEPTQAMSNYAKNDNTELTGKLNTLEVNREGYYVFKVTLSDELWEKIKNQNISDYKFYGLHDSEAKVSSSFINGLLGTWEILTMKGEKMTSFGVREFLMIAFLNAGTPFTMFLAKLIMAILGGGCNTGIIAGSFAVLVLVFVKFRKH